MDVDPFLAGRISAKSCPTGARGRGHVCQNLDYTSVCQKIIPNIKIKRTLRPL